MASAHSRAAIIKALVGNGAVTIVKAVAWLVSGSGAMLSETIHSLVDTLNQALLLVGNRRSLKAPTHRHPYGFGIEANFWGLLAAIGILVFGGGLSIQHGIEGLAHPHMPTNIGWVFGVLAVSILIEAWVLFSVLRDMAKTRGDRGWIEHLKAQPPGALTVVLEDSAAVGGCVVAAVAVGLCLVTGNGVPDAVGQLTIGIMLAVVGLALIYRNRGMLIGTSLPAADVQKLRVFLEDLPGVDRVTDLKTRRLGPNEFRLKLEVVFNGGYLAGRVMQDHLEEMADATDKAEVAELLGHYSDHLLLEQARHVDRLERRIRKTYPGAVNIDIEPHVRDI